MKIAFSLSYNGREFNGFQKQEKQGAAQTIQGILEAKIQKFFKTPIAVVGSGRTDAGVHADEQVVVFTVEDEFISKMPLTSLKRVMNNALPTGIYINWVKVVEENFHPRYQAKVRLYRYSMIVNDTRYLSAHLNHFYLYPYPIKINHLKKYFACLEGEHDFTTFSAQKSSFRYKVRKVFKIDVIEKSPFLLIDIYGNAFLRSMIRSIVGNSLFACRKNLGVKTFKAWLLAKNPLLAKNRVPAKGLVLKKVFYTSIFD